MYTAEVAFTLKEEKDEEIAVDILNDLLGAFRMNGQVLGREFPIGKSGLRYRAFVLLPEVTSLDKENANKYVSKNIDKLSELYLNFSVEIIGQEPTSAPLCTCDSPKSYVLYTNYISIESPMRCGDCFGVIPLYKTPHTNNDEYYDVICWQSDYQACDSLQMNSSTGERFGNQQISRYDSSLSKRGLEICRRISELTGIQTYYYLYKGTSLGRKSELNRKCPSCRGEWLLEKPLHDLFDFRCEKCGLLSNISWSIS